MPSNNLNFKIEIATLANKDETLQFLRRFFFKDEPVNNFLGLIDDERPTNKEAEAFCMENFDNGLTLLARYDEKLIGVCLSEIIVRKAKPPYECEDETFSKLLKLFEYVGEKANPFQKHPDCARAVSVGIISVDESYRGQGIAKKLLNETSDLARDRGCDLMTVTCTSFFTALALERLGFELYYSLDFADYKVNGEVVLRPKPPHRAVTVYTKKIRNK